VNATRFAPAGASFRLEYTAPSNRRTNKWRRMEPPIVCSWPVPRRSHPIDNAPEDARRRPTPPSPRHPIAPSVCAPLKPTKTNEVTPPFGKHRHLVRGVVAISTTLPRYVDGPPANAALSQFLNLVVQIPRLLSKPTISDAGAAL
jgi:hypothetical protein